MRVYGYFFDARRARVLYSDSQRQNSLRQLHARGDDYVEALTSYYVMRGHSVRDADVESMFMLREDGVSPAPCR